MKLNIKGLALTSGILWGVSVFLLTLVDVWRGHGEHLSLLSTVFAGYTVSYLGSVLGLIYGFVDGLICGALFGWLYNRLSP
jgi:hypothetical protein